MLFTSLGGVCLCNLLSQLASVPSVLPMRTDYRLKKRSNLKQRAALLKPSCSRWDDYPPLCLPVPLLLKHCLCLIMHDVCERDHERERVCVCVNGSGMWLTARMRSSLHQTPLHMAASQTWDNAHHTHSCLASFISLSCLRSLVVASVGWLIFSLRDESVDKMMILYWKKSVISRRFQLSTLLLAALVL